MKLVKMCYRVKYCLEKIYGEKISDITAEKLITVYYGLAKHGRQGTNQKNSRKRKVVVSMTSIPSRIDKVWITIESLLRQSYKPDKILLWLGQDEFKSVKLPDKLTEQIKRGVEIRYCENLKSYKKFYYAVKEYPHDYIIVVDDDVIYTENMLAELVQTYQKNRGCVICHRSHCMTVKQGELRPYNKWVNYQIRSDLNISPTYYNFFTGCAGILFPMFLMDRKVLEKDAFMRLAPNADDVWLNFCAWISGLKIKNTEGILGNIISIESSAGKGLMQKNVSQRENDLQIKQVLAYFNINIHDYL